VNEYSPATLPPVDAVEIVDLRQLDANLVAEYMQIATDAPCQRLDDAEAQPLADAWRKLQIGESARCHVPPIGFRFIADGLTILEASVCWQCDNLFGVERGNHISFGFDSQCLAAQKLLSLAKEVMGSKIVGDG